MKLEILIITLLNYLAAVSMLFMSVLRSWSIMIFLKNIFFLLFFLNTIIAIIVLIIKVLSQPQIQKNLDIIIEDDEDDLKDLLKQASQLQSEQDEENFKEWNPN